MAANQVYDRADQLALVPTDGAHSPVQSGDPCVIGSIPAVALTDGDADATPANVATVAMAGAFTLTVGVAVDAGDIIYYHTGGTLNKTESGGTRFGYALETTSGSGECLVKLGY